MIWIGRGAREMIDMENQEKEIRVPDHVIDNLARCMLPKIQTYFETERCPSRRGANCNIALYIAARKSRMSLVEGHEL